ncbi:hypothetical protein RND81_10G103700 [Saponaria officinalis]|uniref:Phytocyanin domain-containing protein n=1 Tax=Saponaria officinalis TaxID=3572 RepID=A0AAW1HZW5_SAPOF
MAFYSKIGLISVILGFTVMVCFTEARDHLVGGKPDAWKVPSDDSESLSKWAQKNRFNIGDKLVWKYSSKTDSVLQVTREAYLTCNTTTPISEHKNDNNDTTTVVLDKSGPHYFISGLKPNCDKGEKLIVVVITPRTNISSSSASPAVSPALSPSVSSGGAETPAVAPTSAAAAGGVKGFVVAGFGLVFGLFVFV